MQSDGTEGRVHVWDPAAGTGLCGRRPPSEEDPRVVEATSLWRAANCVPCRMAAAPASMPRVYVAGPLSSDPSRTFEEKAALFADASARLDEAGYVGVPATYVDPDCGLAPDECVARQVHNMVSQGQGKHSWECYLRADLRALLLCDGVALLPAWQLSPGARLEFNTAVGVGVEVLDLGAWLRRRPSVVQEALSNGVAENESDRAARRVESEGLFRGARPVLPDLTCRHCRLEVRLVEGDHLAAEGVGAFCPKNPGGHEAAA